MSTVWVVSLVLPLLLLHGGSTTPLDDYVNRPDSSYKYEVFQTVKRPGYTLYDINMTSQTWKPDLQSQPVWWHYMQVTVPDVLKVKDVAFLFISGGSNKHEYVYLVSEYGSTIGTIFSAERKRTSSNVTGENKLNAKFLIYVPRMGQYIIDDRRFSLPLDNSFVCPFVGSLSVIIVKQILLPYSYLSDSL